MSNTLFLQLTQSNSSGASPHGWFDIIPLVVMDYVCNPISNGGNGWIVKYLGLF